jgi:hypothetical protein
MGYLNHILFNQSVSISHKKKGVRMFAWELKRGDNFNN